MRDSAVENKLRQSCILEDTPDPDAHWKDIQVCDMLVPIMNVRSEELIIAR